MESGGGRLTKSRNGAVSSSNSPLLGFSSRKDAHVNQGDATCQTHVEQQISLAEAMEMVATQVLHSDFPSREAPMSRIVLGQLPAIHLGSNAAFILRPCSPWVSPTQWPSMRR